MKKVLMAGVALAATSSLAVADISRTSQSPQILFQDVGASGGYFEFSYADVNPEANSSSTDINQPLQDYHLPSFGYLRELSDQFDLAVIYDHPYGADVGYNAGSPLFGGRANISSEALTVLTKYQLDGNSSVFGGIRALKVEGSIYSQPSNPANAAFYTLLDANSDAGYGYVLGGAYEIPDIALRVALTYNSSIDLSFDGTEQDFLVTTGAAVSGVTSTGFDVEFPESLNLEFQTGVATDTLAFGSIRRGAWDGMNLSTPARGQYVNFTSDSTAYTLGVGRRFSDAWAGSVSYNYLEEGNRPSSTALAPTTGLESFSIGAQYSGDGFSISGGVTRGTPGDQTVNTAAGTRDFNDNEVTAVGIRIGYQF